MLDDNWLIDDVIALVFYIIFPVFILSGIVGLWRTRSKAARVANQGATRRGRERSPAIGIGCSWRF